MARDRVGDVGEYALLVVPHAVAVGVDHRRTHGPRIQDRVVCLRRRYPVVPGRRHAVAAREAGERGIYPLVVPGVEPGKRQLAHSLDVRHVELGRDYVAALAGHPRRVGCRGGRRAEQRVEAVEHLVVVVHSVAVGVGDSRVGRRVARDRSVARDHEALGDRVHVERVEDLSARRGAVPRMARRREVACGPPSVCRPRLLAAVAAGLNAVGDERGAVLEALAAGGEVGAVGARLASDVVYDLDDVPDAGRDGLVVDERPAVPRLGRVRGGVLGAGRVEDREAASVAAAGRGLAEALRVRREQRLGHDVVGAFGHDAAHERGGHVVVAEVTHRLGHVLLVVLESVMVEVHVAQSAEEVVPRAARLRVVDFVVRGVAVPRRVHAARDVDDVRGRGEALPEHAVRYKRGVIKRDVLKLSAGRRDEIPARQFDRYACVLHLPSVGDAVEVGVDRARVHAAAAAAHRAAVVLVAAVDEAEVGVDLVVAEPDRGVREDHAPRAALERVLYAVAVGVGSVLVDVAREEDAPVVCRLGADLHCARVGREVLVPPALVLAGVVLVDRLASAVRVAGVDARELLDPAEVVLVVVERGLRVLVPGVRTSVRAAVHVDFPAVRHAVAVGVGAVRRYGRLVAARLLERGGHGLGYRSGGRFVSGGGGRGFAVGAVGGARDSRIGDVRVARLAGHEGPDGLLVRVVVAVSGRHGRVVYLVPPAIVQQEVLVVVGVRAGVDGLAGLAEQAHLLAVVRGIPAVADVSVRSPVPSRPRVEAEGVADLVVHEHVADLVAEGAVEDLGSGLERKLRLMDDAVDHVAGPDPVGRYGVGYVVAESVDDPLAGAVELRGEAERVGDLDGP